MSIAMKPANAHPSCRSKKKYPEWSAEFTFPVASGWIAGESLMGVTLVAAEHGPDLVGKLFSH